MKISVICFLCLGKMIDYVKCLECGTEKSREDTFLDIPLPVRPFGSNVAYNSVVIYCCNFKYYLHIQKNMYKKNFFSYRKKQLEHLFSMKH